MDIDPIYLDLSFDKSGVRNSQKRLKELITEVAVEPVKLFEDDFSGDFEQIEQIMLKRIARVIGYWCLEKHDPIKPTTQNMMSEITNSTKQDITLKDFYLTQVKDALHTMAPIFHVEVPDDYVAEVDELEYELLELEERFVHAGLSIEPPKEKSYDDMSQYYDADYLDSLSEWEEAEADIEEVEAFEPVAAPQIINKADVKGRSMRKPAPERADADKSIVITNQAGLAEPPQQAINLNTLNLEAEQAWQMIYGLMGYHSDYIQTKMLPRWQQEPDSFEKDQRFLYGVFIQAIRNAAGLQIVAGHFTFVDQTTSIDQLWQHYYSDLSQNVGPQLTTAKLDAMVDMPWYQRFWKLLLTSSKKISPIWLIALSIALVFDGLTTYVSLDQTPMEGNMVILFTVLITALFQIADMLVINYREREFEADAMIAKYQAQTDRFTKTLEGLDTMSNSFVQLSMERSQAHANWQAAADSRKMARRGRYWSARIADINVIVTAYGFAYMFLNAEEPMYALYKQFDYIFVQQLWELVNLWVFLMVGLAITVSFVINTAQRTEILGWSMRRLKNEA